MELIISIIAVIISFVTFLYTVLVEYKGRTKGKETVNIRGVEFVTGTGF